MSKLKDLTGQVFGKLTVLERAPTVKQSNGDYRGMWRCKCLCGNTVTVPTGNLNSRNSATCGCSRVRRGALNPMFQGYGDIPKTFWSAIINRATTRTVRAVHITIEQGWTLFQEQGGVCALSGVPLSFVPGSPNTASLDRIDSSGDYTLENVQWVHKSVNLMKNVLPQEDFIALCRAIADHNPATALPLLLVSYTRPSISAGREDLGLLHTATQLAAA